AGWNLLWLIPYRGLYFLLYALGWLGLLRPYDPEQRARLGYVFWVTTVREAIDRLLPVATIGGGLVGVRLMRWRGGRVACVRATVVGEIVVTLVAWRLFAVLGLLLLFGFSPAGPQYRRLLPAVLLSLPIPVVTALLLRYGSVFEVLERLLRPIVGVSAVSEAAVALVEELRAGLSRWAALLFAWRVDLL